MDKIQRPTFDCGEKTNDASAISANVFSLKIYSLLYFSDS